MIISNTQRCYKTFRLRPLLIFSSENKQVRELIDVEKVYFIPKNTRGHQGEATPKTSTSTVLASQRARVRSVVLAIPAAVTVNVFHSSARHCALYLVNYSQTEKMCLYSK